MQSNTSKTCLSQNTDDVEWIIRMTEKDTIEKRYQEALDYLYRFIDYSLKRNFRYSAEKFNLDRMYQLMQILEIPKRDYPIVHIAGTKGKGSVASFVPAFYQNRDIGLGCLHHRI